MRDAAQLARQLEDRRWHADRFDSWRLGYSLLALARAHFNGTGAGTR